MKAQTGIITRMEVYLLVQQHLLSTTAHGGTYIMERLILAQEHSASLMVPGGMYQAVR